MCGVGVVASLLLAVPDGARADTALVVAAEDSQAAAWLEDVETAAVAALRAQGQTRAPVEPGPDVEALLECARASAGCAALMGDWPGEEMVLLTLASRPDDQSDELVLHLTGWVLSRQGAVAAVDRRYCQDCCADTLVSLTGELVTSLLQQGALTRGRPTLRINSVPQGARVMVDNQPVGVTNLEYSVLPGDHVVSVDKAGYQIEVRKLTVLEGQTLDVDVTLIPSGSKGGDRGDRTRVLPWTLTATGVVAIGAGATLVFLHSPEVEDGVRQRTFRESLVPGLVLAGGGAVLTALGAWWLMRSGEKEALPAVAAGKEELVIGLVGRF